MPSKTPKFDEALDQIFSTLVPHERVCKQCNQNFQIEAEDIEFLKKLRVPPPTLCPRCRMQRRLSYRVNLRPVFRKKVCSVPGHSEEVLTFLSPESKTIVYDDDYYRGDEWDGLQFGIDYSGASSFFDQFSNLTTTVPRQTLGKDPASVNSKYVIGGKSASNCYYVSVPYLSENLQYGFTGNNSKDCTDFINIDHAENCYSSANLLRSFDCKFCINSSDCVSSAFLYDCKSCADCFGATNVRNGRYIFFNEQLTKEEYFCKLLEIDLGSQKVLEEYKARFTELMREAIRKNLDNQKVVNSVGNDLRQCNNCFSCFQINHSENLRYTALFLDQMTDSMDCFGGATSSLAYEATAIADATNIIGGIFIRNGQNIEYSMECNTVQNLFGCVGLKNKKFCIFNKQYTEEEYWPKVDELKSAMLALGEYGEFFPPHMSPIAYNDSSAYIEFPLTREEATGRGFLWHEDDVIGPKIDPATLVQSSELPDNINQVSDDILGKAIVCAESKKPFRLNKEELNFYRKHRIALPRLHPDMRILKLLEHRIPYRLWHDTCKKCGNKIQSGYDPAKGYKVYCESCYLAEVA